MAWNIDKIDQQIKMCESKINDDSISGYEKMRLRQKIDKLEEIKNAAYEYQMDCLSNGDFYGSFKLKDVPKNIKNKFNENKKLSIGIIVAVIAVIVVIIVIIVVCCVCCKKDTFDYMLHGM